MLATVDLFKMADNKSVVTEIVLAVSKITEHRLYHSNYLELRL